MLDRKMLLGSTIFVTLAATATPMVAMAQAAPADATEVEELVVTGSRIKRNEYTSTSPIVVITAETQTLQGLVDTTKVLQQSSLASGSFQVNNQLTGFVTTGGPGANTISLRGLGATRTLVLLNGRRVGPAGTRGTVGPVDLNVIPQSITDRIEILKDGASSIYGSDAVAGVVNVMTKSNLDGAIVEAFTNLSEGGGGEEYRLNAAWGKTFDRGYVNITGDYYEQKVLHRKDRDDTACAADYQFNSTTGARIDFLNTEGTYKCYNLFANTLRTGSFGDLVYTLPGMTYPTAGQGNSGGGANGSAAVPAGFARVARAGFPATFPYADQEDPAFDRSSIISPVKRYTIFATGGFDITPAVQAYGELLLNRRESEQLGVRQFFPGFSTANPNNPYGTSLGSLLPIIPLKSDRDQTVDYVRVLAGLRGDFQGLEFLNGWNWDIYAQFSRSDADYGADIIYNDRVVATTGAAACNPALITISGGDCSAVPTGIPYLSQRVLAGGFNAAESGFLFGHEYGNTLYEQTQVEASVTGDLFDLPAGPLGVAVGVSWRYDKIDDTPGVNERSNNLWGSTSAGRTAGDDTVKEIFAELDVPLIKGAPLIESFDLSLSGRYTDYDSYGSSSTHKVGLNWQLMPSIRLRATKGTSFRAPALYELYLANQTSFLGQTAVDPCISYENSSDNVLRANCAAAGVPQGYTGAGSSSALIVTGGGAGVLKAEESEARTLGVIWTPSFIDLRIALDYFEIEVTNEVRQFGAGNIAFQCYTRNDYPNNPYCGLLTRATTGVPQITTINNSYVNVASQSNRGIDLTTRYEHEFDIGKFSIETQFTWQLEDKTQLLGSSTVEDYNGATYNFDGPDFSGQINTRFDKGDWTAFWSVNLLGKASDTELRGTDILSSTRYSSICTNTAIRAAGGAAQPCTALLGTAGLTVSGVPIYTKRYTEFYSLHTFSLRRKFDNWTLQGGVQNVFDEKAPAQSTGQFRIGTASLNGYDIVGRSYFMRLSRKW